MASTNHTIRPETATHLLIGFAVAWSIVVASGIAYLIYLVSVS
jgi:hypothetical protein